MTAIRVLLVDDDPLVRAGLSLMLGGAADIEIVGEAADGGDVDALVDRTRPDVVLMDVRMPVLDGIAATREIHAALDDPPKVLVLTTFELDEYVFAAVRAGASGFLLKRSPPETLIAGVRTLAAGEALLGPSVTRRLLAEFARNAPVEPAPEVRRRLDRLTERETEVLLLLGRGRSNAEIAAALFVGEATVKTHVKRVLAKLELRDRIHAAVFAFDHGLIRPGEGG
jgi:DNA-binding NarL/FixJ family response regulator